jgi:hypothetical protein
MADIDPLGLSAPTAKRSSDAATNLLTLIFLALIFGTLHYFLRDDKKWVVEPFLALIAVGIVYWSVAWFNAGGSVSTPKRHDPLGILGPPTPKKKDSSGPLIGGLVLVVAVLFAAVYFNQRSDSHNSTELDPRTIASRSLPLGDPATPSAVPAPTPFVESSITVNEFNSRSGWKRFPHQTGVPFALQVDGMLKLEFETSDQRHEAGPKGIVNARDNGGVELKTQYLVLPSANYLAVLARFCDVDGCETAKAFRGNPWPMCVTGNKWVEIRVNATPTVQGYMWFPNAQDDFVVRSVHLPQGACASGRPE